MQERKKDAEDENSSIWDNYDAILGMQCRSLTHKKATKKKEKAKPPEEERELPQRKSRSETSSEKEPEDSPQDQQEASGKSGEGEETAD